MYTSDLQLSAEGLRRIEDLPQRPGFQFIGRTRAGRDVNCEVEHFGCGVHCVRVHWPETAENPDLNDDDAFDIVAWKFLPPQNDFA